MRNFVKILFIVTLVLLVVFVLFFSEDKNDQSGYKNRGKVLKSDFEVKECEEIASFVVYDDCYLRYAIREAEIGYCEKIVSVKNENKCVSLLANSLKSCAKVDDVNIRDRCYSELALKIKEIGVCSKIERFDVRNSCIYLLNEFDEDEERGILQCKRMGVGSFGRSECFARLFGVRSEWLNCVQGEGNVRSCLDSVFLNLARIEKNRNVCLALSKEGYGECVALFE